jgi:anaerobic selenocysteine-containing dehydrogenase
VPTLEKAVPEPLAEIHPETAQKYGISDGDMITVETVKGKIHMKARTTEDLMPGIVSIPHGWANANANELTELEPRDPVTGYTEMKSLLCRIRKAEGVRKAA